MVKTELSVRDGPTDTSDKKKKILALQQELVKRSVSCLSLYPLIVNVSQNIFTEDRLLRRFRLILSRSLYCQVEYVSDERSKALGFSLSQVLATLMASHVML